LRTQLRIRKTKCRPNLFRGSQSFTLKPWIYFVHSEHEEVDSRIPARKRVGMRELTKEMECRRQNKQDWSEVLEGLGVMNRLAKDGVDSLGTYWLCLHARTKPETTWCPTPGHTLTHKLHYAQNILVATSQLGNNGVRWNQNFIIGSDKWGKLYSICNFSQE
jgi:hypothetical protein